MIRKFIDLSMVRFICIGLINTLVGLSVIYGLKYFLTLGDIIANFLGYGSGLLVSFSLNSKWTFSYRGSQLLAIGRFLIAFCIAYLTNLFTVLLFIHWIGMNSYLANVVGLFPYTIIFYLISRFFVFKTFTIT